MKYIIGVDLGGTNLRIGLFDNKLNIKEKVSFDTADFKTKDSLLNIIVKSIKDIINRYNLTKKMILGVGLGVPGPVNSKRGLVYFFPNIKGWQNVNLLKILKQKLDVPIYIDNDTNLTSLAEANLGAGKIYKNLVCITLGTGVGGGIIIDKELYRGSNFIAGEIGHIPINEKGPLCSCGSIACLESYVGKFRLIKKAKAIFGKNIGLERISYLAKKRNPKAITFWKDVGKKLGVALSGVVNLLNPDAIIIGGGISNVGKYLFDSIQETIKKRAMPIQARHVKVLKARLKDSGILGAALLVKMSNK
ncbi:MAG: ROK family protein [Candidatus Omnitrophica bacterium]|nr:ROK family protein [Candidatus Omnitrophota bacterium]